MSLSIIIIILLIAAYAGGRRQGLLKMLLRLVTYLCAWAVAFVLARPFGALLASLMPTVGGKGSLLTNTVKLTDVNNFFYNGLSFTIIFLIVSALGAWVIRRFGWFNHVPVLGQINAIAGGLVTVVLVYLLIGWSLMILQYWPGQWMQGQLASSALARWIINKTPMLAQTIISWIG